MFLERLLPPCRCTVRSGPHKGSYHPTKPEPTCLDDTQPVWDTTAAIALMNAGDDLVERLDVSGSDPAIQRAAEVLAIAYRACDLNEVRHAARAFEYEVRRVASGRVWESLTSG